MAITTVNMAKRGVDDLHIDDTGTHQSVSRKTSRGGTVQIRKINASHLPATTTVRDKKFADKVTAKTKNRLDVDAILEQILDNLENIGLPDITNFFAIAPSGGSLTIKADAITHVELKADASNDANRAVTTNHVRDIAITAAKLATDAVETAKIKDVNVTTAKLADVSVTNAKIALDSVGTLELNMDNANHTFSHFVIAAGIHQCAASATQDVSPTLETGITLVSTDIFMATMGDQGAGTVYVQKLIHLSTTQFRVTLSAAAAANDDLHYIVLRICVAA